MSEFIDINRTSAAGVGSIKHNVGWMLIITATIIILLMVVYFIILTISLINNKFSFYFANDFNLRSQSNDATGTNASNNGVLTNDRPVYIYESELSKFKKNITPTAPPYFIDHELPAEPNDGDFAEEHLYDVPANLRQTSDSPVSFDSEFDDYTDDEHPTTSAKNSKKIYENQRPTNENIYLTPNSNRPVQPQQS